MAETPKRDNSHHARHNQRHPPAPPTSPAVPADHDNTSILLRVDGDRETPAARPSSTLRSVSFLTDENTTTATNSSYHDIPNTTSTCTSGTSTPLTWSNHSTSVPSSAPTGAGTTTTSAKRLYRAGGGGDNATAPSTTSTSGTTTKWVTRDIAALDFLLGIPLATEREIVLTGWQLQCQKEDEVESSSSDSAAPPDSGGATRNAAAAAAAVSMEYYNAVPKGAWWAKWILPTQPPRNGAEEDAALRNSGTGSSHPLWHRAESTEFLERPTAASFLGTGRNMMPHHPSQHPQQQPYAPPGRRLDGDAAIRIQIPLTTTVAVTKQRAIARQAALKEWEWQTAHGLGKNSNQPPMLDGRLFFSCDSSYPVSVFSMIRYEPKKEEAAIRRRKLEAIGGGGSQFILPKRDWRGISYRALLPRSSSDDRLHDKAFNRFVRGDDDDDGNKNKSQPDLDESSSTSSESSDDSDVYVPGLLDDPDMVLGRHRTVMIGDAVTGPVVSSSIQFVKPALLKAELNKQFRERFDGWEPPRAARKYIGARVIQGNYVLMDPAEEPHDDPSTADQQHPRRRNRQGSVGSTSSFTGSSSDQPQERVLRMPPSLTLSKIRSLKRQALLAAVKAKIEVSTVALACVYFERLCLDCRVDKSNRRIAFAACLLLALKLNEPNVGLVYHHDEDDEEDEISTLQFMIRPNKRSKNMFASLLLFFTQDWSLSLKSLFDSEWAVFAALGFSLHANPFHVAFHFKRLMKTLGWSPLDYLGTTMYSQWQNALAEEEERRAKRERKHEAQRKRKETQLLNLHIEIENEYRRKSERRNSSDSGESLPKNKSSKNDLRVVQYDVEPTNVDSQQVVAKKKAGTERRIKLFNRFARPVRRTVSHERMAEMEHQTMAPANTEEPAVRRRSTGINPTPSMPTLPTVAINVPATNIDTDGASSIGSQNESYKAGLLF